MTDPHITIGDLQLWGVEPSSGVRWYVPKNGLNWSDAAGSTLATTQRPRAHGAWAGKAFLKARSYSLSGVVSGPSRAATEDAIDRLKAAASIDDTILRVDEAARSRFATVRRDDEVLVTWLNEREARWATGFTAPESRMFADAVFASTALPSSTGGLTVPFVVPFTIDAVTDTGRVSLVNPGNIRGVTRLRIEGPVSGPVVTHVAAGRTTVFASSITLGPGEWIDVDMDRRQVLANGQASRNGTVTQRGWSGFEPGLNSWSFTAAAYDPAARLVVTALPAWM